MLPDLLAFDRAHILAEGTHPITVPPVVEFERPKRGAFVGFVRPTNALPPEQLSEEPA